MANTLNLAAADPALVTCAALIAIRNEARYLPTLLNDLLEQGIDVYILDNESSDKSRSVIQDCAGAGKLHVETLPWGGSFDLAAALQAKQRIISGLSHDWVIHMDADEWLQSPVAGERLREGITRVDRQGYNTINFEEFVFLPIGRDNDGAGDEDFDFRREILDYYFFAPRARRLMRAWRIDAGLNNHATGGHRLTGAALRLAPENFILRHYIGLSQQHIINKYVGRLFARENLDKGWHRNRTGLIAEQLRFPNADQLNHLADFTDKRVDRSQPQKQHYWRWSQRRDNPLVSWLKTLLPDRRLD